MGKPMSDDFRSRKIAQLTEERAALNRTLSCLETMINLTAAKQAGMDIILIRQTLAEAVGRVYLANHNMHRLQQLALTAFVNYLVAGDEETQALKESALNLSNQQFQNIKDVIDKRLPEIETEIVSWSQD
jgi:hypothetical protein